MPIQTRFRLPEEILNWLKARAENADRSMNAELLQLLKSAMRNEEAATTTK